MTSPAGGPLPRIFRYVANVTMQDDGVIASLDAEQNILRINRRLFDNLNALDQQRVRNTRRALIIAPDKGALIA